MAQVAAIQGICLSMVIAPDDEDFISLEIQEEFRMLVTVLFIVAVIFGLWLLEKALRYICKYYKMNNLNSIWIKKQKNKPYLCAIVTLNLGFHVKKLFWQSKKKKKKN